MARGRHFRVKALGGIGGVAVGAQVAGTLLGIAITVTGSALIYGILKAAWGIRLSAEEEFNGADLTTHKISATAERESTW